MSSLFAASGSTFGQTWVFDDNRPSDFMVAVNQLVAVIVAPPAGGGLMKYWNGSAWIEKPVKHWTGSAWVQKPVKFWNGSAWVLS